MLIKTYPAIFYYTTNPGYKERYYVWFPDLKGTGTQGDDIDDAMYMASDWLGIVIADFLEREETLPTPSNLKELSLEANNPFKDDDDFSYNPDKSIITLVSVDITEYIEQDTLVKKTLTIPLWADKAAKKFGLNFSQTLTEAIFQKTMSCEK
ncbi:MAG: type II toxin-antitoxin system HicB family antitoxin [Oscillospiraceae bacterium]|nr:type II toxin-antitoxin system HicB family antitoxin [Oscillospiraceae bacterium]